MLSNRCLLFRALAVLGLAAWSTSGLHAGPPLICHPYTIGSAKSLPGAASDWRGVQPGYDRTHLVRDTLALLTPETPVIVRMETLRRAAIYATAGLRGWSQKSGFDDADRAHTRALLMKLQERADAATGSSRALALFDVGFFAETLRHTGLEKSSNGYELMLQALELRGGTDAEIEFALALASSLPRRVERDGHLARARAGAKPESLLARNLASHFQGS